MKEQNKDEKVDLNGSYLRRGKPKSRAAVRKIRLKNFLERQNQEQK